MKREPAVDATVVRYAQKYQNCAQTSFMSMKELNHLQCDDSEFLPALTALPSIGGLGETCGGVSGPLLALGLALGSADPADKERSAQCHAAAHQFCLAVQKEFGSTRCGDIIERCCGARYDLTDPAEARKYVEAGGLQKCMKVVATTVHLATEILQGATANAGRVPSH